MADDDGARWCEARFEPTLRHRVQSKEKRAASATAQAEEGSITVFVYVDTTKQGGERIKKAHHSRRAYLF
ncbi:hypothetical protein [Bradyrhizobium sp. B117]|uniref:hypothetical protein n=1 Tax=Bradyrhizobium sp. B117 TaxID=3140246 RepID=UPI0031837AFD